MYGVPQYQHCANSHTNRRRLRVTERNLLKQKGNSASAPSEKGSLSNKQEKNEAVDWQKGFGGKAVLLYG